MNAATIVGYTFDADIFHGECLRSSFVASGRLAPAARGMSFSDCLDQLGEYEGVDRGDEYGFDSESFPKVVFADWVTESDACGACGEALI